jgi:CrcB protein
MSGLTGVTPLGVIAVGVGATLGAWLRWLLALLFNPLSPSLPLGTLVANLSGGLMVGAAMEVFARYPSLDPAWRLLFVTGFLGGLTTFSTFSAESLALVVRGDWGAAALHATIHLFGALVAAILGLILARWMTG